MATTVVDMRVSTSGYQLSTLAPRNYPKHTSSVPGFVDDMSAIVMLLATLPWLARR